MTKLIIIRGNSGSGKTTTADALKKSFSNSTLLINQDLIRKQLLDEPDISHNLSISLMDQLLIWGEENVKQIILEGILKTSVYGEWIKKVQANYGKKVTTCYFNLTFDECIKRNKTKKESFALEQMKRWWIEDDLIGNEDLIFSSSSSIHEQVRKIKKVVFSK
ncbi:AAA family ATPase [Xylocopilactobacillus apis]|uniref:UDP-N-acetylglucosamine kinase n=1 Tax=Xylocopilactobacillus apis TaxID=2932183 RepID=A0AAU9CR77_9LACO|nr:AAA family ATPase [Xylocopilactobacillus apis]BDR56422.1 hypothetical protein KIMC2_09840 [Xylocopilactobacillus apis]